MIKVNSYFSTKEKETRKKAILHIWTVVSLKKSPSSMEYIAANS